MAFQPNPEHLGQVVHLLQQAASPKPEIVQLVWQQFEEYSKRADFNCYLACIVSDLSLPESVREWAAIVLKNGISSNFSKGIKPNAGYIQPQILSRIGDQHDGIRNAVANCVSNLATKADTQGMAQLLDQLSVSLASTDQRTVEGAAKALANIAEDCIEQLFEGTCENVVRLIPVLLDHATHALPLVREKCLWATVNVVTGAHELMLIREHESLPPCVTQNIPRLLQTAMSLAMDEPETQRAVCRTLVFVAETSFELLKPHLKDTIEYAILVQKKYSGTRDDLALEACDLWPVIVADVHDMPVFQQKVNELLQVLFVGMVYSDLEKSALVGPDDDVATADKEQNVKPQWGGEGGQNEADDDEEEGGSTGGDFDDDDPTSWTLRKCCASTLDALSLCYGKKEQNETVRAAYVEAVLNEIHDRLSFDPKNTWLVREAAILALGAACEGIGDSLQPSLDETLKGLSVYPIGFNNEIPPPLKDPNPLLRGITCWTLGRLARVSQTVAHKDHIMNCLLATFADRSKHVVGAVCQALCSVLEDYNEMKQGAWTAEQLLHIVEGVNVGFGNCHIVNLRLLFNVVVTITEVAGAELNTPPITQAIMRTLTQRWEAVSDEDPQLQGLMACLAAVAPALGPGFQPWVKGSFDRCVRVIQGYTVRRAESDYKGDEEYIVCAMDLLSGLLDGVGSSVEPLIRPELIQLLHANLKDPSSRVRRSCMALVGDISKWAFPHISPHVPMLLPLIQASLDPECTSVCNNSAWALGEIAIKSGTEFANLPPGQGAVPERFVKLLSEILSGPRHTKSRSMHENCAIAIARMALVAPDVVAPLAEMYIKPFCLNVRNLTDPAEKEHALLGLARIVRNNPNGCFNAFAYICDCISTSDLSPTLKQEFSTILGVFKSHMGDGWDQYYAQFPPNLRQRLAVLFQ
ncbi:Transportin-1 [Diplonema papillatum]|nr:Transportin-1 [Diplonema papillatum]